MRTSPRLSLNNGVLIDQLGFGLYKVPAAEAEGLVATALAAGYRHFDTAAMYGNETGVARGISSQLDAGSGSGGSGELFPPLSREDVFVTTKVWNDHHGFDATLRAFDDSMVNLGLDYVDMYLIHWPCPRRGLFTETYRALETLYREGRVRAIGVSNFQPAHLDRLLAGAEVVPAVNQIELHPWLQQEELRSKHADLGIRTEAWSPLGRGQVLADPVIQACAAEHGRTPAQVILRWHMQLGNIAIPKASSEARIRENLDVFNFELSARDMAAINALDRGQRTGSHPDNVN
ncbi:MULTISPECIES: aldo/keto reductase [Pseudarthrobacter]|uniref:Diketogulonate reductase-like aldo/keto reductase n=1 Tax=Pseudarthrobacter niigatensis TaxID=369935 RepID=A0AAJ1SNX7_9MICC|nr:MULTISPECIES: aldo/keto reductase [Pseudarthrobacter]MDQ0144337.1 diketogulonate reductase-like aldo/keto reductase [Pseudarthrobacter niigatensis]MDQ0266597.1 diketogulonate reductase-like aldo/keto reductase [Pseudarthrobacter niigatensis]QDG88472.1 aldo/keto reductase [Pseudarthrobacter sp. NIBRBAC000502770]